MADQPCKRITIDAPDAATILAARHLDATEGRVQTGTTVDTATRSAITQVLRYISTAHNSPATPSLPASPAPAAAAHPIVQGRCPACRGASLFLGSGGHVTCARLDCPDPCAADNWLHGEQPARTTPDNSATSSNGPIIDRPFRSHRTPKVTAPCPACRRADQAGLAPDEQHPHCATTEA